MKKHLYILLIITIFSCENDESEHYTVTNPITDSTVFANIYRKVMLGEYPDSSCTNHQLEKFLQDSLNTFIDCYNNYKITSPDSVFSIYTSRCHYMGGKYPMDISYVKLKNNTLKEFHTDKVDSILILPDNKYLIMSSFADYSIHANLASFEKDSLLIHPIKLKEKHGFGILQEQGLGEFYSFYMVYDSVNSLLNYSYINKYECNDESYICNYSVIEGSFKYKKGSFVFEGETSIAKTIKL